MSGALLIAIAGLAALDSLNPATIVAVALVLLGARQRPGQTALLTILGAALTVFAVGAAIFFGARAFIDVIDGFAVILRFVAFGAAGIVLIISGVRRFSTRPRSPLELPKWFTPWMAIPFGAMLTAADLPNAFPYFIAIERLVNAQVSASAGLLVLAGYAIVYCVPCLVLLAVGILARDQTRAWLERVTARFQTGEVPASWPIALLLIALGLAVIVLPVWLFG